MYGRLPPFEAFSYSVAVAIDPQGKIAGAILTDTQVEPLIWLEPLMKKNWPFLLDCMMLQGLSQPRHGCLRSTLTRS